jgi:hypothetical protein
MQKNTFHLQKIPIDLFLEKYLMPLKNGGGTKNNNLNP